MKLDKYVPKHILEITPYSLDQDFPQDLSEKYTRISLNENLVVKRERILQLLNKSLKEIDPRLYPEPHGRIATSAISEFFGIKESKIFIGNGLDDVLDRISRIFINQKTNVGTLEPTFSIYSYYIELCQGISVPISLNENFNLDVEKVLDAYKNDVKILFICSPNSPTGNQFKAEDVRNIVSNFDGIVILDETYVDFAKYSACNWVDNFENLIVLKSFSKSYGLAGVRIGYLFANEEIVEVLKKSTHPFNVNSISQHLVNFIFSNNDYFKENIDYIKKERERLSSALQKIDGLIVYPSDANFILFKINKDISSSEVQNGLKETGLLVKDRGNIPLLENCIRVTVSTQEMNDKFLYVLKNILEDKG
ncbi:MAG: histidinol-phosphate transaminase [Candidatus Bathyarchaeota archaeon]|nr:histidinol-phosphate transaminase [Candidatus Bathyarchaeota archaeon]